MLVTTMPGSTQFLQVPKPLPNRKARSRSRSRQRDMPREVVYSSTQVIVSPNKLSFRAHSPPAPFSTEPFRKPSPVNGSPFTKMANQHSSPLINGHRAISAPLPSIDIQDTPMTDGTNYDDLNEGLYTMEQCVTPPPEIPLRQKLVGAWKLESYIAYPTPNSPVQRPTFPMTKNVTGFILYTPDGYMSAQMLIPGQQSFKRGEGEEPQWAEAGKRCFSYCGPYYITNEGPGREEILRHTFQCCSLPGWIGDIQVRTHRFEEDGQVLVLGSEEPTEVKVSSHTNHSPAIASVS